MKVYLVGYSDCESNLVLNVYDSYGNALKRFHEIRLDLLNNAKDRVITVNKWAKDMYSEMVKRLKEEDPEKIDNYPHETPYIQEMELE